MPARNRANKNNDKRLNKKTFPMTEAQEEQRALDAVELDGSQGEGGGQILRTGLALSMVTGRPLVIARSARAGPSRA